MSNYNLITYIAKQLRGICFKITDHFLGDRLHYVRSTVISPKILYAQIWKGNNVNLIKSLQLPENECLKKVPLFTLLEFESSSLSEF